MVVVMVDGVVVDIVVVSSTSRPTEGNSFPYI